MRRPELQEACGLDAGRRTHAARVFTIDGCGPGGYCPLGLSTRSPEDCPAGVISAPVPDTHVPLSVGSGIAVACLGAGPSWGWQSDESGGRESCFDASQRRRKWLKTPRMAAHNVSAQVNPKALTELTRAVWNGAVEPQISFVTT
jgi:hypothetical protein